MERSLVDGHVSVEAGLQMGDKDGRGGHMQVNRNSSLDTSGFSDSGISLHTAQSNIINMSSTGTEANVFTSAVTTENNHIES